MALYYQMDDLINTALTADYTEMLYAQASSTDTCKLMYVAI